MISQQFLNTAVKQLQKPETGHFQSENQYLQNILHHTLKPTRLFSLATQRKNLSLTTFRGNITKNFEHPRFFYLYYRHWIQKLNLKNTTSYQHSLNSTQKDDVGKYIYFLNYWVILQLWSLR